MNSPETAANCAICLINQANYLLDQQLRALEKDFLEKGGPLPRQSGLRPREGGFTEKLYWERKKRRGY